MFKPSDKNNLELEDNPNHHMNYHHGGIQVLTEENVSELKTENREQVQN